MAFKIFLILCAVTLLPESEQGGVDWQWGSSMTKVFSRTSATWRWKAQQELPGVPCGSSFNVEAQEEHFAASAEPHFCTLPGKSGVQSAPRWTLKIKRWAGQTSSYRSQTWTELQNGGMRTEWEGNYEVFVGFIVLLQISKVA